MPPHAGHLTLIVGPMFSGKTSELLRRLRRHTVAGRRVAVFKPVDDTRYSVTDVATHDGGLMEAGTFDGLEKMSDTALDRFDVIGIDEVQFFSDALSTIARLLASNKYVIAAGLDADFRGRGFSETLSLVPQAETLLKLSAVCQRCGSDGAAFSARTTGEQAQKMIGGKEAYEAVCRRCFNVGR